jgi:hypothetical protein
MTIVLLPTVKQTRTINFSYNSATEGDYKVLIAQEIISVFKENKNLMKRFLGLKK